MNDDHATCCIAGAFPHLPPTPKPTGGPVPIREISPYLGRVLENPKRGGHDGEYGCRVPRDGTKRCPQCWKLKPFPAHFDGKHNCNSCRIRHGVVG